MTSSSSPPAEADLSRQATRISAGYFLRYLTLLSEFNDGDMLGGIIILAILSANAAHLDQAGVGGEYAAAGQAPPDDLRRPVSILSIANTLGLPFETTRRHVNKLIRDGKCVRVRKGVIVPQAFVMTAEAEHLSRENAKNLRRLVRDLGRAGFTLP